MEEAQVVESKDGTISVTSAFSGHQEGKNCHISGFLVSFWVLVVVQPNLLTSYLQIRVVVFTVSPLTD
jgi:hypothetical protein